MEESKRALAQEESPLKRPNANPSVPPISRPENARLKLSKRCKGSSPVWVRWMAAAAMAEGAGSTRAAIKPELLRSCQTSRRATGKSQGRKCNLRIFMVTDKNLGRGSRGRD